MAMRKSNRILLTLLFVFMFFFGYAQSKNCGEIQVSTKITSEAKGSTNGSIEFIFDSADKNDFKIFLVNAGEERAKAPITEGKVNNLKSGFYDFVIVDRKGCTKQLTVTVK
jgi:hypothetical protein